MNSLEADTYNIKEQSEQEIQKSSQELPIPSVKDSPINETNDKEDHVNVVNKAEKPDPPTPAGKVNRELPPDPDVIDTDLKFVPQQPDGNIKSQKDKRDL